MRGNTQSRDEALVADSRTDSEQRFKRMLTRWRTNRFGRTAAIVIAGGLMASMSVAYVVRANNKNKAEKATRPPDKAATAVAAQPRTAVAAEPHRLAQARGEAVQTERITLLHDGFEPNSITIPAKKFFLAVDNRSGLTEMDIRLNRKTGPSVHSVDVDNKKLDWSELFELAPGEYILTEANHPGLSCTITVVNK